MTPTRDTGLSQDIDFFIIILYKIEESLTEEERFVKKNRKNKADGRHYPWKNGGMRIYELHCYGGGHRGAAKGRAAHKKNRRQAERRKGKEECKSY